eukprot:183905_1
MISFNRFMDYICQMTILKNRNHWKYLYEHTTHTDIQSLMNGFNKELWNIENQGTVYSSSLFMFNNGPKYHTLNQYSIHIPLEHIFDHIDCYKKEKKMLKNIEM